MRHSNVNKGLRSVALDEIRWAFLFVTFHAVLSCAAAGQDGPTVPNAIVSASSSYQSLPAYGDLSDAWHILYFGAHGHFPISNRVSFSGSIYVGKGSDDLYYLHVPVAGFFLILPVIAADWLERQSSGRGFEGSWIWKLLLSEAVHYNIPAGNVVVISPYVNVLSFDSHPRSTSTSCACTGVDCCAEQQPTSSPDTTATPWMLSTGLGLSVKVFLSDRFVVSPDVSGKYFFVGGDPAWGNDDRFGYTLGLHIGYVF